MTIRWYICPYDTVEGPHGIGRRCAMARHIKAVPNPDNANFSDLEILGNYTLVKVSAPDSLHATIMADPDFRVLPHEDAVLRPAVRTAIRNKLEALGYSTNEINDTGWTRETLFRLVASLSHVVSETANGDGFQWDTAVRRTPGKTLADMDREVPG